MSFIYSLGLFLKNNILLMLVVSIVLIFSLMYTKNVHMSNELKEVELKHALDEKSNGIFDMFKDIEIEHLEEDTNAKYNFSCDSNCTTRL